jgi:hypothetical protein
MSIFAILYTADELTPGDALGTLFPSSADVPERLTARPSVVKRPNFILEVFGIAARTSVYFALDKRDTIAAMRTLGAAVRSFAESTTGDLLVMYIDTPVLRRAGGQREYLGRFSDFAMTGWKSVEAIHLPGETEGE